MGTRRDVASRRSAPSGHVATTTRQRGPFSRCHKVPFLLALSTLIRTGSTLGGRSPRWRVWPCAGEWHPAFRHAPAAGPWACPCSAASARPSPRVPRSRAGSYTCGLCASRGAQAGGVRPLPPPATRRCRGAVPPYAVPRRTRRRGDAVRGAALPAGWDRRRAGTACACCARYSTSWSPASSSSCSLIML